MKAQFMKNSIFEKPFMNSRITSEEMTMKEKILGYLIGPVGMLSLQSVINQLAEKHPTIKYSTLRGYDKIRGVLKKEMQKDYSHGRCRRCGEPSANELCKACSFLEELGV